MLTGQAQIPGRPVARVPQDQQAARVQRGSGGQGWRLAMWKSL